MKIHHPSASSLSLEGWRIYDQAFRVQAASRRTMDWQSMDASLYARFVACQPRRSSVCQFCCSSGHRSLTCPWGVNDPALLNLGPTTLTDCSASFWLGACTRAFFLAIRLGGHSYALLSGTYPLPTNIHRWWMPTLLTSVTWAESWAHFPNLHRAYFTSIALGSFPKRPRQESGTS